MSEDLKEEFYFWRQILLQSDMTHLLIVQRLIVTTMYSSLDISDYFSHFLAYI